MKWFSCYLFIVIAFLLGGCNTVDVYEKTQSIPKHEWAINNQLTFNFNITDSVAYYNIYFVLRHAESYHFNNIWIDLTYTFPGKKPQTQRLNLPLANANGWVGS